MTADKWTDRELDRLEKRIKREYEKSAQELRKQSADYFANYRERWKEEYKAYQKGKYTKEQFEAWELSQLGRGAHWEDLADQMAERMVDTAKMAQDLTNGILPKVYTKNSNEIAKIAQDSAIEQGITGIRFDLVDEYAVARLMLNNSAVRPCKPVALDLPVVYKYSKNKIQNALLQGILQGDSIDKIADRFMHAGFSERSKAIRSARTAVTGAQSAGKQDRYEDLASKGCEMTKIWVATDDDRTRPEHAEADGQEVAIDEPFDVGGEELMYPADPSGSGWNIYNCRCTTKAGKIKFKSMLSDETRANANIRLLDNSNTSQAPVNIVNSNLTKADIQVNTQKLEKAMDAKGYDEFVDILADNAVMGQVYNKFADDIKAINYVNGRGAFSPSLQSIKFDYVEQRYINNGRSKYSTLAHEYGHFFDTKMVAGLTFKELDAVNTYCKIGSGITKTLEKVASSSDEFLEAIRKDQALYRGKVPTIVSAIRTLDTTAGVQDFIDGSFSKSGVRWQHGDKYYNRNYNGRIKAFGNEKKLKDLYNMLGYNCTSQAKTKDMCRVYDTASEAWANISAGVTVGGGELEAIKQYMPNSYDTFIKIVEGQKWKVK